MNEGLTWDAVVEAMSLLEKKPLYYATSEYALKGRVMYTSGSEDGFIPECAIVHPDDFSLFNDLVLGTTRILVPLRDYQPEIYRRKTI